jgi:hypothetical protein
MLIERQPLFQDDGEDTVMQIVSYVRWDAPLYKFTAGEFYFIKREPLKE